MVKIPITTIKPQATPTANKLEVTARPQIVAAKLDILVVGDIDGAGANSIGFGFPFDISFATAGKAEPNNVKPKILTAIVKPIMKDFRLDFGFSLDSLNLFLKFLLKLPIMDFK